jgi:hypothetical protein
VIRVNLRALRVNLRVNLRALRVNLRALRSILRITGEGSWKVLVY